MIEFKMINRTFNMGCVSTYRTELMGFAAILIIVCHAPANGVVVSAFLDRLLRWGGIGVDMFLFLSGVGMYFSLKKKQSLKHWYYHRYMRILVPFIVFSLPYYLFRALHDGDSFFTFLCNITTISFWLRHEGAWFVAMLIPLYCITPYLAKLIDNCQCRVIRALFLCIIFIALYLLIPSSDAIVKNIQMCLSHVPSYIGGYLIGKDVYERNNVSKWMLWTSIFCGGLYIILFPVHVQKNWLLMPIAVLLLSSLLDIISTNKKIMTILYFMGGVSLESYLSNIYLPVVLRKIGIQEIIHSIDDSNYLNYLLVIIVGLIIAYMGSVVSKKTLALVKRI